MRSWTQVVVELILNMNQRIRKKKKGGGNKGGERKGGYRLIAGHSVDGVDGNLKWLIHGSLIFTE